MFGLLQVRIRACPDLLPTLCAARECSLLLLYVRHAADLDDEILLLLLRLSLREIDRAGDAGVAALAHDNADGAATKALAACGARDWGALLDALICAPRNDVFLLQALRWLALPDALLLLERTLPATRTRTLPAARVEWPSRAPLQDGLIGLHVCRPRSVAAHARLRLARSARLAFALATGKPRKLHPRARACAVSKNVPHGRSAGSACCWTRTRRSCCCTRMHTRCSDASASSQGALNSVSGTGAGVRLTERSHIHRQAARAALRHDKKSQRLPQPSDSPRSTGATCQVVPI